MYIAVAALIFFYKSITENTIHSQSLQAKGNGGIMERNMGWHRGSWEAGEIFLVHFSRAAI